MFILIFMVSISLSLDRELSGFVNSEIQNGVAVSAEDYLRFLVKKEMTAKSKIAAPDSPA